MTKKEYLTHLDYGVKTCPAIRDAFKELIEEHFEPDNVILILMRGNYGYRESTRTFFEENRFFPVQRANPES